MSEKEEPDTHVILHTSDWHLRDSQYTSSARGDDFTEAAYAVIDVAMGYGVKAICNCGDILNNKRPSSRNIKDLVEIDRRLQAAGIPMYVISGNHDFARPSWISILHEKTNQSSVNKTTGIIDADNKLLTIPGTNLTLYGIPSLGATAFRKSAPDWPEADILMSHELVKEFVAFPPDPDSLSITDYPTQKYQACLLGDIHTSKYQTVGDGKCLIGYPGSIELCSKSEPANKTVTLLDFNTKDNVLDLTKPLRTVATPSRKALFYRILTEDQADQATKDLSKYIKDDPIVLVRYSRQMSNIPATLMTMLAGSKAILRCAAFADIDASRLLLGGDESVETLKSPRDFVADFIPPGTDLFNLASALADPESDHRSLIVDYVNQKMEVVDNESDTFEDKEFRSAQVNR